MPETPEEAQHGDREKTDGHDEYESDRRGEHKYPDSARNDAERPSQRERDELKERLEESSRHGHDRPGG